MIEDVSLDDIRDNPFQTRLNYNQVAVQSLAQDIKQNGMLQIPTGRRVDGVVQLAFGHRRFRAIQWLSFNHFNQYTTMQIQIEDLSDEQMAIFAWSENDQRENISPIEEARGIDAMIRRFGWTQLKSAQQLNMSRSAIANKLRLLSLPGDIQNQVHNGQLSERQATAILPAVSLPASAKEHAGWAWHNLQRALEENAPSDTLRKRAEAVFNTGTQRMLDAPFPMDFPFNPKQIDIQNIQCTQCEHLLNRNGQKHCADMDCYQRKVNWYVEALVRRAADELEMNYLTVAEAEAIRYGKKWAPFRNTKDDIAGLDRALNGGSPCMNLVLVPGLDGIMRGSSHLHPEGHPTVCYTCKKGAKCECRKLAIQERDHEQHLLDERNQRELNDLKQKSLPVIENALKNGQLWEPIFQLLRIKPGDFSELAKRAYALQSLPNDAEIAGGYIDQWMGRVIEGHKLQRSSLEMAGLHWGKIAARIRNLHTAKYGYTKFTDLIEQLDTLIKFIAAHVPQDTNLSAQIDLDAHTAKGLLLDIRWQEPGNETEHSYIPHLVAGDDTTAELYAEQAQPGTLKYAMRLVQYRGDQPRAKLIQARLDVSAQTQEAA